MKIRIVLILLLGLLCSGIANAQTSKEKVAVYVTGDAEAGVKKVLGAKLVTAVTRSKAYTAVERTADFLNEIAKEHDYQLTGAVSDKQIALLGQQFGVRYVLVADVSEVFESTFISARFINVTTAEVTNSADIEGEVRDASSLIKLADKVTVMVLANKDFANKIKLIGPFSTAKNLDEAPTPDGYHRADSEEVEEYLNFCMAFNKTPEFPIYTDIKRNWELRTQYYTRKYIGSDNTYSDSRSYVNETVSFTLIKGFNDYSTSSASYCDDREDYEREKGYKIQYNYTTTGLSDMSFDRSITPGYILVVKNEKEQ